MLACVRTRARLCVRWRIMKEAAGASLAEADGCGNYLCHTFNIIEANKISCVEIMRSLFMQRHDSGVRFTDVLDDEWVRLFSVLVDDLKPLTEIHKNEGVEPYYPAVDESDGFLLRSADEVNL